MLTDSVHQALNKSSFEMLATVGEQIHQMQNHGKAITAMLQNKVCLGPSEGWVEKLASLYLSLGHVICVRIIHNAKLAFYFTCKYTF